LASSDEGRNGRRSVTHLLSGQPAFLLFVLFLCVVGVGATALLADWRTAWASLAALIVGMWGAYVLGERKFDKGDPRVGARQALRQVVTHYSQLGALLTMVEGERHDIASAARDGRVSQPQVDRALFHISFQLGQQLATANDAIDNWKEILPEEVDEIQRQGDANDNATETFEVVNERRGQWRLQDEKPAEDDAP
jgi:flagellar biosynthesis chaperone FliJ